MNLTVKAVVLKESNYGEGDKILTVLAEGMGKIQVWAKKARRVKSALLGFAQPFTCGEMTLFQNKGAYYCDTAEVLESHFALRKDLEKLSLAGYFADLVCHVVQEGQAEDDVMRLFLNSLYLLTYSQKTQAHIKAVFEMRLMAISGFAPELHHCIKCGADSEMLTAFELAGGTVCEGCRHGEMVISPAVQKALMFVTEGEDKNVFSFTLTPDVQKEFSTLCEKYVIRQMDDEMKTLSFYKSLLGGL